MAQIKIISNPYDREIQFQEYNLIINSWVDISDIRSNLIKAEYKNGFFPFKAKKIVDDIVKEYKGSSKIELIFEGTKDEFKELEFICQLDEYQQFINLSQGNRYLKNAKDILPDIRSIFNRNLKPLITETISESKRSNDFKKFDEASDNVIPLCIIGNYSSGKSTFINALVGHEILPCGDEPVTAKIYKISRSKWVSRATIEFEYENESIRITLDSEETVFNYDDNDIVKDIKKELDSIENGDIFLKLNRIMNKLNYYALRDDAHKLSDLIQIVVPFNSEVLNNANNDFVIFDTPGSNSATYADHAEVLKKAMSDLSNGLPIYISEYNTLDSKDNENLYQMIKGTDALDDRFTMIVVNKADRTSIKKSDTDENGCLNDEKVDSIMSQAIPNKLYRSGIYFVSSVIGLGTKLNGEFLDEANDEIYEDVLHKFQEGDRHYTKLYEYNIMPDQIKQKVLEYSRKCNLYADARDSLVYANSGLYCIEKEIVTFADKYSSYNKCKQSYDFLKNVIQLSNDEITNIKANRENDRDHVYKQLTKEKNELVSNLKEQKNTIYSNYKIEYPPYMQSIADNSKVEYSKEELKQIEDDLTDKYLKELNINQIKEDKSDSRKKIFDDLSQNLSSALSSSSVKKMIYTKDGSSLSKISEDLKNDIQQFKSNSEELDTEHYRAKKLASEETQKQINQHYHATLENAKVDLDTSSKSFWKEKAVNSRNRLISLVTNSSALNEEQSNTIEQIILNYGDIQFDNKLEMQLQNEDFMKKEIKIAGLVIIEGNRLHIDKIGSVYNANIKNDIDQICKKISESHQEIFREWLEDLVELVESNIISLNPDLRFHQNRIDEDTLEIKRVMHNKEEMEKYTIQIENMMDWKEAK